MKSAAAASRTRPAPSRGSSIRTSSASTRSAAPRDGLPYYAMPFLARGHLGQRDFTEDGLDTATRACARSCMRCSPRSSTRTRAASCIATSRPRTCCSTKPSGRCWPTSASPCASLRPARHHGRHGGRQHRLHGAGTGARRRRRRARRPLQRRRARLGNADRPPALHGRRCAVDGGDARAGPDPAPAAVAAPLATFHRQVAGEVAGATLPQCAADARSARSRAPAQRTGDWSGSRPHRDARCDSVRHWPKTAWVAIALVVAAATGIALRQGDPAPGSFFRASTADRADLPTPGAQRRAFRSWTIPATAAAPVADLAGRALGRGRRTATAAAQADRAARRQRLRQPAHGMEDRCRASAPSGR